VVPIAIDVQRATKVAEVPTDGQFAEWARRVLREDDREPYEVAVRVVDGDEMQSLNRQYRRQDKPTNVLSFPAFQAEEVGVTPLGDIVICAPVVLREAQEQGKTAEAHWAHMMVHGLLHLLGYDHEQEHEADEMEGLEVEILARLGYPNPYVA
jgi:probable rRNA maturation factor